MYITEEEIAICLDTMLKVVFLSGKLGYTEEETIKLFDAHTAFIRALRIYYDTIVSKQADEK